MPIFACSELVVHLIVWTGESDPAGMTSGGTALARLKVS